MGEQDTTLEEGIVELVRTLVKNEHIKLPAAHVETRFHPTEVALLDEYVTKNNYESREDALRGILRKQTMKLVGQPRIKFIQNFRLRWQHSREENNRVPDLFLDAPHTVIISDEYDENDRVCLAYYRSRTGCRSDFAVPRHTLLTELRAAGTLAYTGKIPVGFTRTPIT